VAESLGNGRYRITGIGDRGSGIRIAYAVKQGASTWVFLDGRTYVVESDRSGASQRRHATDDQMAFAAPMPATVVAISVKPGDAVREGDLLIMLEAMKMELPIKAPRDGRVKSIACREGELVQPGVALVEFESQ
jgi:biotin carboxyl carrier protein